MISNMGYEFFCERIGDIETVIAYGLASRSLEEGKAYHEKTPKGFHYVGPKLLTPPKGSRRVAILQLYPKSLDCGMSCNEVDNYRERRTTIIGDGVDAGNIARSFAYALGLVGNKDTNVAFSLGMKFQERRRLMEDRNRKLQAEGKKLSEFMKEMVANSIRSNDVNTGDLEIIDGDPQ